MVGGTTKVFLLVGLATSLYLMYEFQKSLGDVGYMVCNLLEYMAFVHETLGSEMGMYYVQYRMKYFIFPRLKNTVWATSRPGILKSQHFREFIISRL